MSRLCIFGLEPVGVRLAVGFTVCVLSNVLINIISNLMRQIGLARMCRGKRNRLARFNIRIRYGSRGFSARYSSPDPYAMQAAFSQVMQALCTLRKDDDS